MIDDVVLRQALDDSPDGVVIVDGRGTIVYVNHATIRITGFDFENLVGRSVEVLVPARIAAEHVGLRAEYTDAPRTRPMGRGLMLTANSVEGREVPVEISLSPVTIGDRQFTVASLRDISERLEADERLQTTREMLALSAERERIARDLHDTVLQRLFGLGLELHALGARSPSAVSDQLERSVDEIDQIIREIRTSVFTLGAARRDGSLGQEIGEIIAQASRVLGFSPRLQIEGPLENMVGPAVRIDVVAALREGLANVARHSRATSVSVELLVRDGVLRMRVVDNGVGCPSQLHESSAGNGLRNLTARAAAHGGSFGVVPGPVGGTSMEWSIRLL